MPSPLQKPESTAKIGKTYARAGNDPRINPQPVTEINLANIELVVQRSRPLDTSLPVNIVRNPRPLARAINDPRKVGG